MNIAQLIHAGGVFDGVEGSTPEEVFKNICSLMSLPNNVSTEAVYDALCAREKVISTAVGNGIALPHARATVLQSEDEQRICVAYLKEPMDMLAPDGKKVYVMFVLLTQNSQSHLQILSSLGALFHKVQFRKVLESHAVENELLDAIREVA